MHRRRFLELFGLSALWMSLGGYLGVQKSRCHWEFNDEHCTSWRLGHWSLMNHRLYGSDNVRARFWPKEGDLRFATQPEDFIVCISSRIEVDIPWPFPEDFAQRVDNLEPLFKDAANGRTWISFDDA